MAAPAAPALAVEVQVAEAAREFLLAQAEREGLQAPEASATALPVLPSAPPAACRQAWRVQPGDTRFASRMRFAASCPGETAAPREFIVRAELTAEVVVASRALPANQPLAAADLALERRDVSAVRDALSDIDAVEGLSGRRALKAGQVVQKGLLIEPLLVKRGALVRIVARTGPVEVSASGEALDAGRRGEIVRVRNVNTGKVIRARVAGDALVEPADMP
ncbi:MAG TPA: flagellar basal body P-ring formation chaperone FlgA [Ideonella sp.]|nr:flagellar basal body P-ring formation chaperone FlgA [Ideonella sp.]